MVPARQTGGAAAWGVVEPFRGGRLSPWLAGLWRRARTWADGVVVAWLALDDAAWVALRLD